MFRIAKATNEKRTSDIRNDYYRIWDRTEELRQGVF